MATSKRKKEKLSILPKEKRTTISRRPYDIWMDMDRLFDSFRSNFDELFWGPGASFMTDFRKPITDVEDLGDKYEMRLEMPGIKKEDINIEVTPHMIEVSAEHTERKDDKGKNWLRQERSSMDFYRRLELPEDIKTGNVNAELNNGVLKLELMKSKPKPKIESKKVKIK